MTDPEHQPIPPPELASKEDKEWLERCAADVLENMVAEERLQYGYITESGAMLVLRTVTREDEITLGSYASVLICREHDTNSLLTLTFGYSNQQTEQGYDGIDDLMQVAGIVQELLDSGLVPDEDQIVLQYAKNKALYAMGLISEGEVDVFAESEGSRPAHIANVIRSQVAARSETVDYNICTVEELDDGSSISVELSLYSGGIAYEEDILANTPLLKVIYSKADGTRNVSYLRYPNDEEELFDWNPYGGDVYDEEWAEFEQVAESAMPEEAENFELSPTKVGVDLLTGAIIELDLGRIGALGAQERSAWVCPTLYFNLDLASVPYEYSPQVCVEAVVEQSLAALYLAERFQLPEACPDGFPAQPDYRPNPNRANRIDRYLAETVGMGLEGHNALCRRSEIIDEAWATRVVRKSLSASKHPVAQLITQLERDHSKMLGPEILDHATVNILKQTHWPQLKAHYDLQVGEWRHNLIQSYLSRRHQPKFYAKHLNSHSNCNTHVRL